MLVFVLCAGPVGDGTVLTRNAYALAFNYASHEGNRRRLAGLDEYDLARADACARYGEKSGTRARAPTLD